MHAQPSALLSNSDALALETHIVQLVEATMISTPELSKAGAPLLASARAALTALHRDPMETAPTYRFLASIRAYLALADAVPKPYPFPQAARDQFTDLRDSAARLEAHFAALLETRDGALNGPDPDKLQRYGDIDTRLNPPDPRKPRVVFVGDSITDDWRLNEYFPDRDFVNRGISGQTTDQMLGRFEEDVVQLHPLAVVIFGGTNDLYRRIPVAAVENNIRAMAELAQFNGIRVLIATLLPVSDYHKDRDPNYERSPWRPPEEIREVNRWIQSFCASREFTFVDYYSEVVDAAGFLKPDLSDDGLHPNSKGYRIMAPLVLQAVEHVVSAGGPQQKPRRHRLLPLGK
jgi:lysophospholipase L1-like esterase